MTASERANAIIGRLVRKGLREHVSRIIDPLFEACREELEAALVADSNLPSQEGAPTIREIYEKLPGHTIGDEVYFHGGDVLTALEKERERLVAALHERDEARAVLKVVREAWSEFAFTEEGMIERLQKFQAVEKALRGGNS